mmetsp:Transcript_38982/g.87170  ORF Transcript_38982/g.87170 Transcript_38982/m.87170 type:complete len:261 (+) Transcript_38982:525-1307(+)
MLRVVGQVLVQVRQRVGVAREVVVEGPELVAHRLPAEGRQVHHVERADVVGPPPEVVLPVARAPELVAEGLLARGAEGGVGVGLALEVEAPELGQVAAHRLVRVHVDHPRYVQREEHVQKQDLVAPDDALLRGLLPEPARPLVRDEAHLEAVLFCHGLGRVFEGGAQVVLQEPELDGQRRPLHRAQHHDLEETLVEVARREGEHMDLLRLRGDRRIRPRKRCCSFVVLFAAGEAHHVAHLGEALREDAAARRHLGLVHLA